MSTQRKLSPIPHPTEEYETSVVSHIEKIEGEVARDSYVKAQTSAPEVVRRIQELENCLWRLANATFASVDVDKFPELRIAAEEAQLALNNRLVIDDSKHRFRSQLGRSKD